MSDSIIDTSNMSERQRAALELAESSLDTARDIASRGITRCQTLSSENKTAPDSQGYRLARSLME